MPQVRWSATYDRGTRQKPGQLSQGSGTTPTLIGKDLVAITDNAEPRMNVLFYKRDGSPRQPADLQGTGVRGRHLGHREQPGRGRPLGDRGEQLRLRGSAVDHRREDHLTGSRRAWCSRTAVAASRGRAGSPPRPRFRRPPWATDWSTCTRRRRPRPLDDSWYFTAIDVRTGTHPLAAAHRQRHPVEQPLRLDLPRPGRCGLHADHGRAGAVPGRWVRAVGFTTPVVKLTPTYENFPNIVSVSLLR